MSDKKYLTTIGLEVHAELKTRTKMFCDSKNDADEERPNVNICPICMGHPGTLPVINKAAVKHVLTVGCAVEGTLADFTEFDRKNYFYPDIPKGYQISQYKYPLVSGGTLAGVALTRVHLEEDTARSSHETGDYSLVDFNRAGVPLMELVTEPVIHSAEEASRFARELQLLLRFLGASDANMEKGEMRVEANISVSTDPKVFGTKVEVKNLNSFRAVERAIAYEVDRHISLLEAGEKVAQETRGWNEGKQETFSQRAKEDSHDYRYFPDPDLPKLTISEIPEFSVAALTAGMPELPWVKRARYERDFGMPKDAVELFLQYPVLATFFEAVASDLKDATAVSLAINYVTSDLVGLAKVAGDMETAFANMKCTPSQFAALIRMFQTKKVSSRGVKDILVVLFAEGGNPETIATEKGLVQKSDAGELKTIVAAIIEANPKVVADYKSGKAAALQFLVGQGMKATKGAGNPAMLAEIIQSLLA